MPVPADKISADPLTRREREIAELVTQGLVGLTTPGQPQRVSPPESQASRDTREAHSYLFRLKRPDG